jgi:6-phosphogluconolactonase (cycloisomerase 2 family)
MPKIVNRAYMTTATTGTGTITLGSAVGSFRSFAASGVVDGDVVRYVIEDGDNWEIGSGTYAASGTTLTRAVEDSSSGGTAITLTGSAVVFVTAVAADFGGGDALGTVTGADLDLSTGNFFEVTAANQTLSFSNPPAAHAFSIKVTGAGAVSGFDLSIASYAQSFSVLGQETFVQDLFFKSDGAKMYVVGSIGDDVNEYDLSTAWDISTASYLQNFSVVAQGNGPTGLFFHPDGIKMYVICQSSDSIHEYNLSIAWDISTAAFVQSFSVVAQDTIPQGLFFRPDGLKVCIVGREADEANEYNLSIAWDISTAAFVQSFSVTAQDTDPTGLAFNSDGTKMFVVGNGSDSVHQYTLTTGFDVSTASYDSVSFSVAAQETNPTGLFFHPDGIKMYVSGPDSDAVHQYTTGSVTTATITYPASVTFEAGSPPAAPTIGAVKTVDLYTVNGGTNYYDKGVS